MTFPSRSATPEPDGVACPVPGCVVRPRTRRAMFDHLGIAHTMHAEEANEAGRNLSPEVGWDEEWSFVQRQARGAAGSTQSVSIGPRPLMPPEESWPDLVGYLLEILHTMHSDRHIPKYQFERHIDSLLVPFLPEMLGKMIGGNFQFIAPEFPLKKTEGNQSTNADGLLHQNAGGPNSVGIWWLFELKTDQSSVSNSQINIYDRACLQPMSELMDDLSAITKGSKTKREKYRYLTGLLHAANASFDEPVRLVYLSPRRVAGLDSIEGALGFEFADILELDLEVWPYAWRLVRDHLLRPIVEP